MKDERNFNEKIYDYFIRRYKEEGDEMYWTMEDETEIKIKDMKDSQLKNNINTLSMLKRNSFNKTRSAWTEIFESEFMKRRNQKIDKIIDIIHKIK